MLLIVGARGSGKQSVLRGIEQCLGASDVNANARGGNSLEIERSTRRVDLAEGGATFLESTLLLDTKYYTAEVQVWVERHVSNMSNISALDSTAIEGLILVMKLSESNSLDKLAPWGEFATSRDSIEFRILVGTHADALTLSGKERQKLMLWCVDRGFEFVEVDCKNPLKGGETREKEGIPRIVEAMLPNRWTGMELKKAAGGQGVESSTGLHISYDHDQCSSSSGSDGDGDDFGGLAYAPLEGHMDNGFDDSDDEEKEVGEDGQEAPEQERNTSSGLTHSNLCPASAEQDSEHKGALHIFNTEVPSEKKLTEMEQVMREVQRVRETSSMLPDKERKEAAAEAALKLLSILGIEEDSDSEEEQEVSCV